MPSYEATLKFKILAVNNAEDAALAARKAVGYLPEYVHLIENQTPILVDKYPTVSIISN